MIKQEIYTCKKCKYSSTSKYNYLKHLKTKKHSEINMNKSYLACSECKKVYRFKSGLSRHRKNIHGIECESQEIVTHTKDTENAIVTLKNMFKHMMKENKELHAKVIELTNKPTVINNKNINVIQFLNTDCKDAINLSEFIDQIPVTYDDLVYIQHNGYIEGMRSTLLKNLNEMDTCKRPIHCTDFKRKRFVVKDQDVWERDEENRKLLNALNQFNTKQLKTLYDWKQLEENKNWEYEDKKQDGVLAIMKACSDMYSDEHGSKMKNKLLHEISNTTQLK